MAVVNNNLPGHSVAVTSLSQPYPELLNLAAPIYEKLAQEYKIIVYRKIVDSKTMYKEIYVKKSIANKRPVLIAVNCPPSFNSAGEPGAVHNPLMNIPKL